MKIKIYYLVLSSFILSGCCPIRYPYIAHSSVQAEWNRILQEDSINIIIEPGLKNYPGKDNVMNIWIKLSNNAEKGIALDYSKIKIVSRAFVFDATKVKMYNTESDAITEYRKDRQIHIPSGKEIRIWFDYPIIGAIGPKEIRYLIKTERLAIKNLTLLKEEKERIEIADMEFLPDPSKE